MNAPAFESCFVSASDGLRLHYRDYAGPNSAGLPVVCLPGLARTSSDFGPLARALVATGRRVLALDYRGRGLSDRDPDPANYDLRIEGADALAVLTAAGISEALFVGTSRGGLITMLLAALRPTLIAGAVLNDIGPVIEVIGLRRIRGYVGQLPQPATWDEAVGILKRVAGAQFTALTEAEWRDWARSTFREDGGRLAPSYDPALLHNLQAMDLDALPTLWPQFEALGHAPVLIVRGDNTDLLSMTTVDAMRTRHPDCAFHAVPGQGHAPLLADRPTIDRIVAFASRCEASREGRGDHLSASPSPHR